MCLILVDTHRVAGGSFTAAGPVAAKNVAIWTGASWNAMSTGLFNPPTMPELEVTCFTETTAGLLAGTRTLGLGQSFVAQWNGATWTTIGLAVDFFGLGNPTAILSLTTLPNGNVAVGAEGVIRTPSTIGTVTGFARWDGTAFLDMGTGWSYSPWGGGPSVASVALLGNGDIVASGGFSHIGGPPVTVPGIARWDGTNWTSIDGRGGESLLMMTNGTMIVGGNNGIARWGCDAGIARTTSLGTGCYRSAPTFYERFDTPHSVDLGNSTLQMTLTATGYDVAHIPGSPTFADPTSSTTSIQLVMTDDSISQPIPLPFTIPYPGGSTNVVVLGSNGCVFLQPPTWGWVAYYGQTSLLLANEPGHAAFWGDLDPGIYSGGAGTIHVDIVGQTVYATWLGIQEFGSPGVLSTFQIAMSANGNVEYRYLACDHTYQVLTGWCPGYGAQDPTSRDLTAGPFSTTSSFQLPLALAADHRAVLGSTVLLSTSDIPAASLLAGTVIGWTQHSPGTELSGLGMPGCFQYSAADAVGMFVPNNGAGTHALVVPNYSALLGVPLYAQSIAFASGVNALGAVTSNGLELRMGNP